MKQAKDIIEFYLDGEIFPYLSFNLSGSFDSEMGVSILHYERDKKGKIKTEKIFNDTDAKTKHSNFKVEKINKIFSTVNPEYQITLKEK